MTLNSFIKVWLIIFIICMSLVAFVNILIDPYSLWNTPRIDSLNKLKPASATRSRLVKPHQLSNFKANTLIMGNSRPEMGINPDSACWPNDFKPIYNQAIPGVSLFHQFRLLQHAAFFHKPDQIFVGIDFNDFISAKLINKSTWPPKNDIKNLSIRLDGKTNPEYPISVLLDQLKVTLSLEAFSDSLLTIFSQIDQFSTNRTTAGFNTANDYKKIIATEGQAILFLQKNISMIKRMDKPMHLLNEDRWSQYFETFRQLLKYSEKENINVTVFINPYHSDYLEIIRQAGHWKLFTQWKEVIAQTTLDFKNFILWDFALVNEYTTEQPPKKGNTHNKINWFWEPAHYNKNFGDLMLGQIFKTTCNKNRSNLISGVEVISITDYIEKLKTQESLLNSSRSVSRISKLFIK